MRNVCKPSPTKYSPAVFFLTNSGIGGKPPLAGSRILGFGTDNNAVVVFSFSDFCFKSLFKRLWDVAVIIQAVRKRTNRVTEIVLSSFRDGFVVVFKLSLFPVPIIIMAND